MRVVNGLGRAFWVGLVLIGLSVVAWFIAPSLHSCVIDFTERVCDTTGVVVLNVIGLILFLAGAMSITLTMAIARDRARRQRKAEAKDTR